MTDSPFIVDRPTKWDANRTERALDIQAFAKALAVALAGTYQKPDAEMQGADRYANILINGGKAMLGLTAGWKRTEMHKVTISIAPVGIKHGSPVHGDYKLPDATVSTARPMKIIAADIARRVIEPAKAPLQKRADWHAEQNQSARDLKAQADRLAKRYPQLRVTIEAGNVSSASIFSNGSGHYLAARLYPNGSVSIDRIATLQGAEFERVADALWGKR